jgi:cytochrome c-type protein NapC
LEGILTIPAPTVLLYLLIAVSIVLVALIVFRPSLTDTRGGKILAFVAFCGLPIMSGAWGLSVHFERSKQTSFCLSCHIMEPYGRSLFVDDAGYVPAAHFQNHRIPSDEACYTCHTDYAMYGSINAKLHGLRHVYVQYLGKPMEPIQLYSPYNNRGCLHCHAGSRSFEDATHVALMDSLKSNQLSCITSGCHGTVHEVKTLQNVKFWSPAQ